MKKQKAPTTIYLKELEREELEQIAEEKNKRRIEQGKKELPISTHIHQILQIGIDIEMRQIRT